MCGDVLKGGKTFRKVRRLREQHRNQMGQDLDK
jgi:hypothetical protein